MNISSESKQSQSVSSGKLTREEYERVNNSDYIGTIYKSSGNLVIIKESVRAIPKQFIGCVRSSVTGFSHNASTRMRRYLRECCVEYTTMLTLTYPGFYPSNGKQVKEHLRRFLQELRREYIRQHYDDGKHSAFWFLEFQSRGAPHYHIFTNWSANKEWVSKRWYEIVGSDDIRHLHAGTRVETLVRGRAGTISYASKYAVKAEQKEVPENYENVGRFWGVYGRRAVVSAATFVTNRERAASDVKSTLRTLFKAINSAIFDGFAEVLIREQGVCVISFNNNFAAQKVRTYICRLSMRISRMDNLFIDAELDFGEGKQL
jgi:hypothetical protein